MSSRISLLEKYEIDVEKLDYAYIGECANGSELEKIYKILLSNEEGFYPDLTRAAKDRLAEVKPNSKYLRSEEKVLTCHHVANDVQEEVKSELSAFLKTTKDKQNGQMNTPTEFESPSIPIRGEPRMEIVPINDKGRNEQYNRIEEIVVESLDEKQLQQLESYHRNKGNNFYRAKEHDEALLEYNRCLKILPTASGYNNRAITCEYI